MKKLIFMALILCAGTGSAQSAFGLKGGVNYGATGDYETASEGMEDFMSSIESENKIGFHFGFFANLELFGIFLQPELLYTRLNTDYGTFEYKIDKIDAPVLIGLKVLGPLNVKAGPSFQYILNNKLKNTTLEISDVERDFTVGYQLGVGLNFGNIGLDARYEGAFEENSAFSETASENFKIDSRPSQWIFSLAYRFN